jgi:phenylalanine-4-hydroxylase
MNTEIVELDADHPGFSDPEYRKRRNQIAAVAARHEPGTEPERVEYIETERQTWSTVLSKLRELYPTHACHEYNAVFDDIGFTPDEVPQLADIDAYLRERTGFRVHPVAGLVESRDFLAKLADRVFPCTSYIRHHSSPEYTPEPDILHELLGHIPMLGIQEYADLMQIIGKGSLGRSDEHIEQIGRLYWYTVEFGVVRQKGELRAYGAGLLSSFGELQHAVAEKPEIRKFDPEQARALDRPITTFQPVLWEVVSIKEACYRVAAEIERMRYEE